MRRLVLYAHFDPEAVVHPYVLFGLDELKKFSTDIVFVSTAPLHPDAVQRVAGRATVLLKENRGFDFGMWQHALEQVELTNYDEVILTNSSVVGPLCSLESVFSVTDKDLSLDVWSITDNYELAYHLQSYFIGVRRPFFETLESFLRSVLPYRTKRQVILSYELGMTVYFLEAGARTGALVSTEQVWNRRDELLPHRFLQLELRAMPNLCIHAPQILLELGSPFVKKEVLRANPAGVELEALTKAVAQAGVNTDGL